jgi:glycosyltransferase involved in cell wall biosynthesis
VRFVGYVTHPEQWFADATLFVLPSRQEGLPNALLEAAAAGLPIVALPSSEGLVALIRDQLGIWLADEISTAALVGSMQSALQSIQHGDRFKHVWINEFAMDRAILRYESLIDATISGKQR